MNSINCLKSAALLSCLLGLQAANGQVFNFDIPQNGVVNTNNISVQGTVTFNVVAETVVFDVTNTSTSPSDISGVFLLKPFSNPNTLNIDTGTFSFTPDWGTTGNNRWDPVNSMDQDLAASLPGTGSASDYVGATVQIQSSPDVISSQPLHEQTVFTFSLPGLNAFDEADVTSFYENANQSLLGFRWQSITNNTATSAKGYGGFIEFDIPVIPVPEPSQIAALSMLGLGGMLFIRRRIKAKRVAKA